MTLWTSDPTKARFARQYFSTLNPMAARIVEVQTKLISSFPNDEWMKMSVQEQEEAMNKCIITPDAVTRYHNRSVKSSEKSSRYCKSVFPKLIVDTGQAFVKCLEDSKEKETWKDEHSDPFSWETKSQMNMSLPPPIHDGKRKLKSSEETKFVENKSSMSVDVAKKKTNGTRSRVKPREVMPSRRNGIPVENGHRKMSTDSNKSKPDVALDDVKIVLKQPKSKSQPNKVLAGGSDSTTATGQNGGCGTSNGNTYGLSSKDIRRHGNQQKHKTSSRINPRASLTLDDKDRPLLEDETGAIRNLEVAMLEEKEAKQTSELRSNYTAGISVQNAPSLTTTKLPSDDITEESPKLACREDSPLLKISRTPSENSESSTSDVAIQKTGYDFLDNW